MDEPTKAEAWERFLRRAAYFRGNPRFEPEERGVRLELARRLRVLLEAARSSVPLRPSLDALFVTPYGLLHSFYLRPPGLDAPGLDRWLEAWRCADEPSLRHALLTFVEPKEGAKGRFARFIQVAGEAPEAGLINWRPRLALTLGALLNFALEPHSLPIVRVYSFEMLERILGYDPKLEAPLIEQYENHVAFARCLEAELRRAKIPVRDMLDVQALAFMPTILGELWERDPPGDLTGPASDRQGHSAEARRGDLPYLSVCSCLGYDAPYLLEWIEFHRLVGVERFFLYNNGDRERQRDLLAPYVEDGVVVLHDWPTFPPIIPAHEHCVREHRADSRWIAFIDTDEFLFSPTDRALSEVLAEYEAWPGVCVNQAFFGPSGHRTKPPGLVIENYVQRILPSHIKSIVDPAAVTECVTPHHFLYRHGSAVDENFYPTSGETSIYVSLERLRINHYSMKSEEEFRTKLARPQPGGAPRRAFDFDRTMEKVTRFGQPDHVIFRYIPALRQALEGEFDGRPRLTRSWPSFGLSGRPDSRPDRTRASGP